MNFVVLRLIVGALLPIAIHGSGGARKQRPGSEEITPQENFEKSIDTIEKNRYSSETVDLGVSRIVGGFNAEIGEFPFFAEWGPSLCGGALIAEDVVLTAGHCEAGIGNNTMFIGGVESEAILAQGDPRGGVVVEIAQRVIHPLYNQRTLRNDFTLLKLTEKVSGMAPIIVNSDDEYPSTGQDLIVMGYGLEEERGIGQPTSLQEVTVQKTSDDECFDQYGPLPFDIMFCAGVDGGGRDSCQGDSGGPIITRDASNNMIVVGVVSFGIGCGRAEAHGVYARVSGVYDWIKSTACDILDSADDVFCGRSLPPADSSIPTPNCNDLDGTFLVDEAVGEQDCEWLRTVGNPRYEFLCSFISVASICRGFCDSCHYFER